MYVPCSRDRGSSEEEDDSTAQKKKKKLMRPVNREGDPSYISEMKKISQGALEAYMRIGEAAGKVSISSYHGMEKRKPNRKTARPGAQKSSALYNRKEIAVGSQMAILGI